MSEAVLASVKPNLSEYGIRHPGRVHWNLPVSALVEQALNRGEGLLHKLHSRHGEFRRHLLECQQECHRELQSHEATHPRARQARQPSH